MVKNLLRPKGKRPMNPTPPPASSDTTFQISIRTSKIKYKDLIEISDVISDYLVKYFNIDLQPIEIEFCSKSNKFGSSVEFKSLFTLDLEHFSVPVPQNPAVNSSEN